MKTGHVGGSVQGLRTGKRESDEQGTDIRKDMVKLLEEEREKIVQILQNDIGQLISIAKMQLSGEAANQANAHLAMALTRLRSLTFELQPDILHQLELSTALTELFTQRFSKYPNRFALNLQHLPEGMSSQMETAIFRVVQKTLSHFSDASLAYFALQINRTGSFVYIKSRFELEPSDADFTSSDFCEKAIKKALNTLVYLFYGTMHCQAITDNQMDFIVVLDENQLH